MTLRVLQLFLLRRPRRGGGTVESRPAAMTINALRLVLVPALGTNQLGHAVGSFPGLFVVVDVAGGVFAAVSFTAGTGPGASFLAASLYELLR